jgi:hypothetical protein
MSSALLSTLLALPPLAAAPQEEGVPQPDEFVRSIAAELAGVGVVVDLDAVKLEVRSRLASADDIGNHVKALYGAEGLDTWRQILAALGHRIGSDRPEMIERLARERLEALGAYYQPEENTLYLIEETLPELADHELALALALAVAARDQKSDLAHLRSEPQATYEQRIVLEALVNGEALNAVQAMLAARSADPGESSPEYLDWRVRQLGLARRESEAWIGGRQLIAHALLASDGAAKVEAFWSTPPSGEQVLHRPKRGKDQPATPALPDWPEKAGEAELLHEDTLGELGVYALLLETQSSRSKARLASLGWDGDVLRRYRTAGGEDVIVWRTLWDRPMDAQQFVKEWGSTASGQTRLGGRTVDWVLADSRGIWSRWIRALESTPSGVALDRAGVNTTEQIEEEWRISKRNRSYIVANEWRFPKYKLTVVVPIGWYEDERDGFKFVVREKTAGYRDNIYVLANPSAVGQTEADILEINKMRMEADDLEVEIAEIRQIAGRDVAFLRYHGHVGDHQIIHTSAAYVQGDRQVAVTMSVEERRWGELERFVDYVFENLRFGPVPLADAE